MSLVSASATVAVYCARLSIWLSACPLKLRSVSPEIWIRLRDARGIDVRCHRTQAKPGGLKENPSLPAVMPVGRLKLEGIRQPCRLQSPCFHASQQVVKRGLAFKLRLKVSDHLIEDGRNDWNVQLCHRKPSARRA